MNRRQRVVCAIKHQETDIIPYTADFTKQQLKKFTEYIKDPNFFQKAGLHIISTTYNGYPSIIDEKKGLFKDDFGVIWNRSGVDKDIGVIEEPLIKNFDLDRYVAPKLDEKKLRNDLERTIQDKGDRFAVTGIGFSLFERAWSLCGMEETFIAMAAESEFLNELLDKICEYNMKVLKIMLEYPFDGIIFGDDWGQQKGLMMGAENWRKYIKPRLDRLYKMVKKEEKFVIQHSCGDIQEIFPDLIGIGLDVYQTFQPEIYDMKNVKDEFGDDLCFWGGISTQTLLPYATPEEVRVKTAQTIEIMGKSGGYIAAPTHDLPGDIPPENILAMFHVFVNQ